MVRLLAVDFVQASPAPTATNISAMATQESVNVKVSLSIGGIVYVAAFHAESSYQVTTDTIVMQGNSAATVDNQASVVISNLIPSTVYDIFILTKSLQGSQSLLSDILQSKQTLSTLCCRNVTITLQSKYVFVGQSVSNFVGVSIAAAPPNNISVELKIFSPTANSVTFLVPSVVMFSSLPSSLLSAMASLSTPYVVSPGTITLSGTLSGADANKYAIVYPFGQAISVLAVNQEPPTPHLSSAYFSSDGSSLAIQFDSPTNQGGQSVSMFGCSQLFVFTGSSVSTCQWSSPLSVQVFLGPSASIVVGQTLALRGGSVQAPCTQMLSVCNSWSYSPPMTVLVLPPSAPFIPVVTFSMPSVLGLCSSLTIDLTSSSGSGGRSWRNVTLEVQSSSTTKSQISQFLSSSYEFCPPTPIPASMMAVGTYSFTFTLCNFLGYCGQASSTVSVVNMQLPSLVINGLSSPQMYTSSSLSLSAVAYMPSCVNSGSSSSNILLSWTVLQNGVQNKSITSISLQSNIFLLKPYSLAVNTIYTIQVQAVYALSYASTVDSIQISVLSSNLVAIILGGLQVGVRMGSSTSLDASGSYDPDKFGVTGLEAGLQFAWRCSQAVPVISSICPLQMLGRTNGSVALYQAGDDDSSNTSSTVTVTVFDSTRGASASCTIVVLLPSAPTVSVYSTGNSPTLNPSLQLYDNALSNTMSLYVSNSVNVYFFGTLSSTTPSTVTWTVNDPAIDLSSIALTPAQFRVSTLMSGDTVNLVIGADTLPMRSTLTFTLTCSGSNAPSTSSSISITTNGFPLPGSFTATPFSGTELQSQFRFIASSWQDENLPLTFAFGFMSTLNQFQVLQPQSSVAYGSSVLPRGAAISNYTVSLVTMVYDSYQSNNSAVASVQVIPSSTATPSSQLQNYLSSQTLSTLSVEQTTQLVSLASAMLNAVSCSAGTRIII